MFLDIVKILASSIIGYLLGSANTSLIVGKFFGVDVRKHGSGNAGMTNTLRTLGKGAAGLVILGDVLKGVLACLIGLLILGKTGEGNATSMGLMAGGIGSILGHNWPLYFGFKGGKGVLTTAAVAMMMNWELGLILLLIFVVIVAITRYVSLGSIIGAACFPIFGVVFKQGMGFIFFASVLSILVIVRHRANIGRLIHGNESKIGSKKNKISTS